MVKVRKASCLQTASDKEAKQVAKNKLLIAAYKLVATKKYNGLKITLAGLILYGHKACVGASPDSMLESVCCFWR